MKLLDAERRIGVVSRHINPGNDGVGVFGSELAGIARTATDAGQSVWHPVPQAPPDAILGITEAFKADKSNKKLNLGVGAYRTEEGKPYVLNAVKKAQRQLLAAPDANLEYLPIAGLPDFSALTAKLAFGEDSRVIREGRNATVQSLSGTGSLRIAAEFLAKHYQGANVVYLPDPTWANHSKIFPMAGLQVRKYRYWDQRSRGLDFEGMLQDLRNAPDASVLLLHACAHNPTGVDPTPQQWRGILEVVQQKRLLPFFDSAYQGFASGDLEGDAAAIRLFANAGLEMMLAQSYAKNMGLYGERVGALTVVTRDPINCGRVESQLKATIRPSYSSPPRHGAEIVITILQSPDLYTEWREELSGMAGRIKEMRTKLHGALLEAGAPGNWDHIINQIGMFSYTGLSQAHVEHLRQEWHIYLTLDGRISMAGLNSPGCTYLAQGIADALKRA